MKYLPIYASSKSSSCRSDSVRFFFSNPDNDVDMSFGGASYEIFTDFLVVTEDPTEQF